ncbi:MAG TPA: hypothetical protein V6D28_15220 [Leptolyngbyaceae cyanobacterium]
MLLHQALGMLLRLRLGCQKRNIWQPDSPIFAATSNNYFKQRKKRSC